MYDYQLIDQPQQLQSFAEQHQQVSWVGFDTEFIGEKRYYTQLCLIQIASEFGYFIIDPISLPDIDPILEIIQNPAIKKITHAGENDYRLFFQSHDILPKNVFDTQIAAGFIGYNYPAAFHKVVSGELGKELKKSFTVTDWSARPISNNQVKYAMDDILPLFDLWQIMTEKLERRNRLAWAEQEFKQLQAYDFYYRSPYHEALNSRLMFSLKRKDRLFLARLFVWRQQLAEQKDYSKDMILSSKLMPHLVRGIRAGKNALRQNRRIPHKIVDRYGELFEKMYQQKPTTEEEDILRQIPREEDLPEREEILLEILYLVVKLKCEEEGISLALALPRGLFKAIKEKPELAHETFGRGWRSELFGTLFTRWLSEYKDIKIEIGKNAISLQLPND